MPRAFWPCRSARSGTSAGRNCDATFDKVIVPVPEDADLAWERRTSRLDAGIIHVGMIERLGNAHIVVVDTIAENPNVFYELGLRHAFADKTTILLGPKGTSPPFDTRPIRHFPYSLSGTAISDQRRWRRSGHCSPPSIRTSSSTPGVTARCSSSSSCRPQPRPPASSYVAEATRRRGCWPTFTGARRPTEATSSLDRLAEEMPERPLHHSERAQLLLVVGIALRENGRPDRALEVLRTVAMARRRPLRTVGPAGRHGAPP